MSANLYCREGLGIVAQCRSMSNCMDHPLLTWHRCGDIYHVGEVTDEGLDADALWSCAEDRVVWRSLRPSLVKRSSE